MRIFNSIFPVRFNFNALKFNIPQKLSHFISHTQRVKIFKLIRMPNRIGSPFFLLLRHSFSNKLSCFLTLLHQFRFLAEQNCFFFCSFFRSKLNKIHIGRRIYQQNVQLRQIKFYHRFPVR